jgi:hypothetical protein
MITNAETKVEFTKITKIGADVILVDIWYNFIARCSKWTGKY